ncbi:MAG: NAD(P)H-hydrate dehydratase [Cuneatibacter sp.]|nr:NAD(P)H-hydrate dehydratase [Cuneatibacter sp.]
MNWLVTAAQMKQIDQVSIKAVGIPSVVLMERAALAVTERALHFLKKQPQVAISVVVGTGNNGADGLAVARMLAEHGYAPRAYYLGNPERATEEWRLQASILEKLKIPLLPVSEGFLAEYDKKKGDALIIDAIFGIGLARAVEGVYRQTIEVINARSAYVISVDVPSGIDTDTGAVWGTAVRADETVTFGFSKIGCVLYPGAAYAGKVTVAQIGFAPMAAAMAGPSVFTMSESDVRLPQRRRDSNKGTFGRVLLVAGQKNMAGAACFAAKAILATGAGLVRILTREENRPIVQTLVPEAVLTTWEEVPSEEEIAEMTAWADVIAIGPGLGCGEESALLLERILKRRTEGMVLDADALNLLAQHEALRQMLWSSDILTPHMGELARLLGSSISELKKDLIRTAKEAAGSFGAICVCKDAVTVIAEPSGRVFVNTTGNEGMATGGSGDVLTGVIAGMLAAGAEKVRAAEWGVYLHGAAGDAAKKRYGSRSMGPQQIIEGLEEIIKAQDDAQDKE